MAMGNASLDMFLRILLVQPIHFRATVPYPGFWVDGKPPMMQFSCLTPITHETDANLRAQKLHEYKQQAEAQNAQYAKNPVPKSHEQRGNVSKAQPPDFIRLGPPTK
jgi:hypothetical protein